MEQNFPKLMASLAPKGKIPDGRQELDVLLLAKQVRRRLAQVCHRLAQLCHRFAPLLYCAV